MPVLLECTTSMVLVVSNAIPVERNIQGRNCMNTHGKSCNCIAGSSRLMAYRGCTDALRVAICVKIGR